jgi:hypothetical protein
LADLSEVVVWSEREKRLRAELDELNIVLRWMVV